jgi:hypothetical protein
MGIEFIAIFIQLSYSLMKNAAEIESFTKELEQRQWLLILGNLF